MFFYSISFGILAYTASGTLYVDQHASLLCLLSIYILIMLFRTEEKFTWFYYQLSVGLLFTKPAPSVYVILSIIFIISVYIIDKEIWLAFLSVRKFFYFNFMSNFFKIQIFNFHLFWTIYFLPPRSVKICRFKLLFKRIVFDFKFIYLAFAIIIVNFIQIKNYEVKRRIKFYYSLSLLLLIISLIFIR